MITINRSCTPEQARALRDQLTESGWSSASTVEEAEALEAEGKDVFLDTTNGGTSCFSAAEMADFRLTPIEQFHEHQARWGRGEE